MQPQEFSLESYDCIGFDLDHTICTYKLKPLMNLIYKTLASFLINKYDYPRSLSHFDDSQFAFAQKGIILDKHRGNFLKLDGDYRIIKASHGKTPLTDEEVKSVYGYNCMWEKSRGIPHKLVANTALDEPFYVFKDYFVTAGAVICANIVDILDKRNGGPLDEYNFWEQYLEGLYYMYDRNNFKNNAGEFYPELKSKPELYLKPCSSSVKNWIKNISENKVTFLLTSSNYDSASFLAEYSLGKDWKNYFDIIVTFARKPGFFWKDKPFCFVNENGEVSGIKPEEMKTNSIYSQGNWKHLQEVCAIHSKTAKPKALYFGDSLIEDVYAASEIGHCDSVAIVEELSAEGMENAPEIHDESDILVSNFWGSFFGHKRYPGDRRSSHSLWSYLLSQHSKLTIPSLHSISVLGMNDKVSSFGADSALAGFYPGIPKVLSTS